MTQTKPQLRYSIVAEMAQKTSQPPRVSQPFSLAEAMRQKVDRERSAG